jgi:DNA-binding ferritin-like protein (Dps family)
VNTKWLELVTGPLAQKKGYRRHKARIEALPEPYRASAKAFQRYFLNYAGIVDGDTSLALLEDFADLWERAAADTTPISEIVGDDPVDFAETFCQSYTGTHWIDKERARLAAAVEAAERKQQP